MYVFVRVRARVCVCMYVCMYVCACVCACVRVCVLQPDCASSNDEWEPDRPPHLYAGGANAVAAWGEAMRDAAVNMKGSKGNRHKL